MKYKSLLEQRLQLQSELESINNQIATYEADILEKFNQGESVTGFTLKKGRLNRKVKDEGALIQRVTGLGVSKSHLYMAKLKGVPALEQFLFGTFSPEIAKQVYQDCIEETRSKPTVQYTGD